MRVQKEKIMRFGRPTHALPGEDLRLGGYLGLFALATVLLLGSTALGRAVAHVEMDAAESRALTPADSLLPMAPTGDPDSVACEGPTTLSGADLTECGIATECPVQPTVCEETKCPGEATRCPVDPTKCEETVCPIVDTHSPVIFTECGHDPTECTCTPTECPEPTECEITKCPEKETECPEVVTKCPVMVTVCETEPICCPHHETVCPPEATKCPEVVTKCPPQASVCEQASQCQNCRAPGDSP